VSELDDAIAERDAALLEATRLRIAGEHGIKGDDIALLLTGTDEDLLTRQAEGLVKIQQLAASTTANDGLIVGKEGSIIGSPAPLGDARSFVRNLFSDGPYEG
jgi:hypothetical protein